MSEYYLADRKAEDREGDAETHQRRAKRKKART